MTDTDSERYDIFFAGECLDGHGETAVRAALARLFRADPARLERLFSGSEQRIKRGVDSATARRYEQAMQAAGARAIVRLSQNGEGQDGEAAAAGGQLATGTAAPAVGTALDLAPAGGDLLRPDERPRSAAVAPDVSHLSLADAGATLGAVARDPAPAVTAPDFSVAEAGADLAPTGKVAPPPALPDTSAISLVAPEQAADATAAPPAALTPLPDTSGLSLADAGADLLREDERRQEAARAPDTSHLQLRDDEP